MALVQLLVARALPGNGYIYHIIEILGNFHMSTSALQTELLCISVRIAAIFDHAITKLVSLNVTPEL
jgi:hypothetical protein